MAIRTKYKFNKEPFIGKNLLKGSADLLSYYAGKTADALLNETLMAEIWMRRDFIAEVKEYVKLGNRFWKRKHVLERLIALTARLWLPVIESEQKRLDAIPIKFERYSALEKLPVSQKEKKKGCVGKYAIKG